MTELDDPVRLVQRGHPLAQRPVLVVGVLVGALLIAAIAMGRGASGDPEDDPNESGPDRALVPADEAAEDAIAGLRERERPRYEQPLEGPALAPSEDFPVEPYFGPAPRAGSSPSDEALVSALTAPSNIALEAYGRTGVSGTPLEDDFRTDAGPSWASGTGLERSELAALGRLSRGADPAKYARKERFFREGARDFPSGVLDGARAAPPTPYVLKAGSVIPAVMISGINSDLPGPILAQVGQDVFDTATGRHLVIPQGSKLVGTYDHQVAFAQRRTLVLWTTLVYPDASEVRLEGMPGADPAGYAGFGDQVNRHVGRRVGTALLLTVFNLAAEVTRRAGQTARGFQTDSAVTSAVGQSIAELGREMVEQESEVPNTLQIRPGYRFHVMVQQDLAFRAPYRRRENTRKDLR